MTVPTWDELTLPVLRQLADGQARHWRELRDGFVEEFGLSEADCAEVIPSGERRLDNRVQWANAHMYQAGLLERPRRGFVQITDRGRDVLGEGLAAIDSPYMMRFSEYRDFRSRTRAATAEANTTVPEPEPSDVDTDTPLENISDAVAEAMSDLQGELLRRVIAQPPAFLEELAVKLLNKMGYGDEASGEHRGGPGDRGIDGAIRQDALGLNTIYMQAKRYAPDNPVERPAIQAFVGALHGAKADRGVFITTSRFTDGARDYTERITNRIVLIDGRRLAQLMVQHDIGVQVRDTFVLKRIDEDFFDD